MYRMVTHSGGSQDGFVKVLYICELLLKKLSQCKCTLVCLYIHVHVHVCVTTKSMLSVFFQNLQYQLFYEKLLLYKIQDTCTCTCTCICTCRYRTGIHHV